MGGTRQPNTNSPANLILLCGDGVRGCHGHVEQNRAEARKSGYNISQFVANPATVPVTYWDGGMYRLDDQGGRECLASARHPAPPVAVAWLMRYQEGGEK